MVVSSAGNRINLAGCAVLVLVLGAAASAQSAAPDRIPEPFASWHGWLSSRLPEGKGPYDFAVAMFTGNASRDPVHAEAQRRLFAAWLNTTILPGDTLIVAGAEHRVWTASEPVRIGESAETRRRAFSLLPAGPKPDSRGGKSIEQVLVQLADRIGSRSGRGAAVIMLSNSWSQDGEDVAPSLDRLGQLGFTLHREEFNVPTVAGNRQVLVTAGVRPPSDAASLGPRAYPGLPTEWVPSAYAPSRPAALPNNLQARKDEPHGWPPWTLVPVGVGLAALGVGAGRWMRRAPPPSEGPTDPGPALPIAAKLAEFESVMDNAQKHLADLQTIRDSLLALVANAEKPTDAQPLGRGEAGDLRTELASVQHDLAEWDKTAIAFLEAAEAAVRNHDADERLRRTWQRAADSFCRMAQRHGFGRIAPEPGEPFVPGLHRAVSVEGDPARATTVAECVAWGYQNGPRVYKLADVRVTEQTSSNC